MKNYFLNMVQLFKYQVMSFGLSNTLIKFQNYVKKIVVEKLNVFLIVYFNDILIHTKDAGQSYLDII